MLGPLIPPSIAFVIWGVIAEQSIGRLFLSGVVPGLAIAAGLLVVCYVHARRHKVPRQARATWRETGAAFGTAKWALMSPAIVLGGIYGGVFTPTEAAGVSCVYASWSACWSSGSSRCAALPDLFIRAVRTVGHGDGHRRGVDRLRRAGGAGPDRGEVRGMARRAASTSAGLRWPASTSSSSCSPP